MGFKEKATRTVRYSGKEPVREVAPPPERRQEAPQPKERELAPAGR